jgi:beta-glucosidase
MRAQLGDRLPTFTEAEFALLREAEVDFYGMNYYTSQYARHRTSPAPDTDFAGNLDECQEDKAGVPIGPPSGIFWLRPAPHGFRKHLLRIYKKYGKPIYITENGCPCPGEDKMSREEAVNDEYRQRYFSDHFDAIVGARHDGADVAGYFAWSLIDNLGEFLRSDLVLLVSADLALLRMGPGVLYQVRSHPH